MGKRFRIFLLLSLFFISFQLVSADVISLNSGGSQNLTINSNNYIEGFFFGGINISAPVCGNGIIQSGEQCDNGASNGACPATCSATCTINSCGTSSGGGGGGGNGGPVSISVNPSSINLNLAVNTNVQETILVTNIGTSVATVKVSQQGLGNMSIIKQSSLIINPDQSVNLDVIFVANNDTGIFTGKIIIGNTEIPVTINVQTKLLLFDSNIVVLNKNYEVAQGDSLKTLVTLIPLGDPTRLDVTLDYVIKDLSNKVYLTKSETLLVAQQVQINRNFDTGALPPGKYVIGLVLHYPNGVAPSSAYFTVIQKKFSNILGSIVLFLIIMILFILILIIIILIIRKIKSMRQQSVQVVSQ